MKVPEVLVVEDYLDADLCAAAVRYARATAGDALGVVDPSASAASLKTGGRVCTRVPLEPLWEQLAPVFLRLFTVDIPRQFGLQIAWYERPQLLCYPTGGVYLQHADAEVFDKERGVWRRLVDRDCSVCLYLNDDFSGGALTFTALGRTVAPKRGMLVAFPSDHRFRHAALPTTAGQRFALVSWAAARGTERVGNGPPANAIVLPAEPPAVLP